MRVYPNWHRGLVQAQVRKHQEFDSPYPHHQGKSTCPAYSAIKGVECNRKTFRGSQGSDVIGKPERVVNGRTEIRIRVPTIYPGLYFNGRKLALHARGCAFESHQIHHTRLAQMVERVEGNHEVNGSNPLSGKLQLMLGEAAHSNNLILINSWYNIRLE